jgi:hypothetical protein
MTAGGGAGIGSDEGSTRDREHLGSRLALSRREWRRLAVLGSPTFGMATATTIVSSFLPVVARDYAASSVAVG